MSEERATPTAPKRPAVTTASRPVSIESVENLRRVIQGLQQELIACQRLAMLGSIAAMVTHEFNNLLTPIMARSEAALLAGDAAFMRTSLERALAQSKRAMAVSRHLLDLAHDRPLDADETCPLAAAVHDALETMTRPCAKDNIELRVAVPDNLRIAGRHDLFCQVLLNLLLNARRAMAGRPGVLAITAAANGRCAMIDVRDNGRGIPPELLETVFNPFLAADPYDRPNDWQQVGLGLSVCRLIAHHHGARLEALDNAALADAGQRGCTFRLHWPLAEEQVGQVTCCG